MIYLDFAKAFNSDSDDYLLHKLSKLGIQGALFIWIKDFLSHSTQFVCIGSAYWFGVPQGSVLGQVLFLCYINELLEAVTWLFKIFAYDTKIYSKESTIEHYKKLQQDLDNLCVWREDGELAFNAKKGKVLHIGKKIDFTYSMKVKDGNYSQVEAVSQEKIWGDV